MDWQTILVCATVTAAALYVVRALWPKRKATAGCGSCARNPGRTDDYT